MSVCLFMNNKNKNEFIFIKVIYYMNEVINAIILFVIFTVIDKLIFAFGKYKL